MANYELAKTILHHAYPDASFRSQPAADWSGEFPLPNSVEGYFSEFGPDGLVIEGYGNDYFLPSLASLWAYQDGYRTNGFTHERSEGWDDDWLVIASEGSDPFIFSRSKSSVLHAFCGEGSWNPIEIFVSLEEMAVILAILGDIVVSAGRSLADDDCIILDRYREEARYRISDFICSSDRSAAILSRLDWT